MGEQLRLWAVSSTCSCLSLSSSRTLPPLSLHHQACSSMRHIETLPLCRWRARLQIRRARSVLLRWSAPAGQVIAWSPDHLQVRLQNL